MTALKYKRISNFALLAVACLIHLSGCTRSQEAPSDKSLERVVTVKETLVEFPLTNGTLQVITVPRCQIRFKQHGASDFVRDFSNGANARVIYVNSPADGAKVSGPDALIEWSFEGGRNTLWSLSTHPNARITNIFESSIEHFQISENTPKNFVITSNVVFPDLGGAHQVIVPMTFAWRKTKFVLIADKAGRTKTNAELKTMAHECQSAVANASGDSPELDEAVLRLYAAGDDAGSRTLLHYALKDSARESVRWKNLISAFKTVGQDTDP